jgi:methyl-accepting chemotaxis protein
MKVIAQLRATIIVIFVLSLGNVGFTFFNSFGNQGAIVNLVGRTRAAGQRSAKLALANKPIGEIVQFQDNLIDSLINGNPQEGIPPATDKDLLEALKKVEAEWQKIKILYEEFKQNPGKKEELVEQSEVLFQRTDEATAASGAYVDQKIATSRIAQILVFVANLSILVVIWLIVKRIGLSLRKFSDDIATSSTQIAATVEQQERTVSQQAASVSETTTTMEELGASSRQAAEQAETSAAGASQALSLADSGTKAVQETMESMNSLKENVRAIAEQIMRLSEQTGQIVNISDLVADIANQTNMLALNAAVEAARAGEQGKGFSVVASEIRKLADESKKSAEKINILVQDLQASMNSTVMVTDEGTKKTNENIRLTQSTAETFIGVKEAVNDIFVNSQQISLSAKQQAVATQQVIAAMNAINLGAQETSTGINQVRVTTNQLENAARQLKEQLKMMI